MQEKNTLPDSITIGRLSCLAEVDVATVRFYERSGLLESQDRTQSGYRLYSRNSLARVQFIRRARETGYNLDEIKQVLQLHDQGGSKPEIEEFTARMITEVDEKIHSLGKWRQLFIDISEYAQYSGNEQIEAEEVDTLMRGQCNMLAKKGA
jgi:DNA-binding transcriptional MerR regulator